MVEDIRPNEGIENKADIESASRRRANYALAVLFIVTMLNFLDRQVISIVAEPIKRDLGLSDTQLGLMTGLSFAIFYTTLAIPLAALADRWNRSRIIAIAIAIWSLMTVLCGLAGSFVQLFLARVGVGIGEAGSAPASHSLIADLFPPERRAGALHYYRRRHCWHHSCRCYWNHHRRRCCHRDRHVLERRHRPYAAGRTIDQCGAGHVDDWVNLQR